MSEPTMTAAECGGLYPTKTRLALLEQIDTGRVFQYWYGGNAGGIVHRDPATGKLSRVGGRAQEMIDAGWVDVSVRDAREELDERDIVPTLLGVRILARTRAARAAI